MNSILPHFASLYPTQQKFNSSNIKNTSSPHFGASQLNLGPIRDFESELIKWVLTVPKTTDSYRLKKSKDNPNAYTLQVGNITYNLYLCDVILPKGNICKGFIDDVVENGLTRDTEERDKETVKSVLLPHTPKNLDGAATKAFERRCQSTLQYLRSLTPSASRNS